MAGTQRSTAAKADGRNLKNLDGIQSAIYHIRAGLDALHELAIQHENGVTGETLSVCVEQMTLEMLTKADHVEHIISSERSAHHG